MPWTLPTRLFFLIIQNHPFLKTYHGMSQAQASIARQSPIGKAFLFPIDKVGLICYRIDTPPGWGIGGVSLI